MKKVIMLLAAITLLTGLIFAHARDYEMSGKTDDYSVVVKLDKNPPVRGTNRITVEVKDAAGKAVTNANVVIHYGMPPMPGMGAMNYRKTTELKGEIYQAALNFSMSGPWYVDVRISRDGSTQTVKLNVDIR
ncbi:MAG TPA: FixH family protein [Smithellaceae bacterium]|nr:FixH family protein [Smithellaceae bacterium]HRS89374.1 FixH family protein [Smithellaceae bacterium]HRV26579.1 FixH family protein [Smithellaceae bacterium]